MEQKPNGATLPDSGTIPPSDAKVVTTPSSTTPTGQESEGKVTIDLKEYRDLQRAKARTLSFEKRAQLNKKQPSDQTMKGEGSDDPEIIERLNQAETARAEAERKAMRMEVQSKVRDLLEKDEFKALPRSTKDLILRNPAMLSEAENVDEALLDIEDFVREQTLSLGSQQGNGQGAGASRTPNASGHETPPSTSNGTPAPIKPAGLEDVTNLRGPERSRALIRNGLRKAKGVQ